MAKIIIDDSELPDPNALKSLEMLARFFDRIDNPYRMPQLMVDWLENINKEHGGVDTYQAVSIGFAHNNSLTLRFIFKRDMIQMEFTDPYGMRLMELRLHV